MSLTIVKGTTGFVQSAISALDTGWSISGIYANHQSCNSGFVRSLTSLGLTVGRQYTFQYTVSNYKSGYVQLFAGTNGGNQNSTNGIFTDTLFVANNAQLSFFSNGALSISILSFYDTLLGPQQGATVTFNEKEKKWGSERSGPREMMVKFLDQFLTLNSGNLWLENSNVLYNNFYGTQYSAQVMFISNQEYLKNKLWFNIRLDSRGAWYVQSMNIVPNDQFPNGMMTKMTQANMKSIDGKLWGDILRDVTDPNFANIPDPQLRAAVAAFQGRMMQGGWVITTLQNDDANIGVISSAELYYIDVEKSL